MAIADVAGLGDAHMALGIPAGAVQKAACGAAVPTSPGRSHDRGACGIGCAERLVEDVVLAACRGGAIAFDHGGWQTRQSDEACLVRRVGAVKLRL